MGNHPKTTLKTDVLQSQSAQGPMLYTLQVFLPMPSRQVATNTSFLGPMRGVRYRYNMGFEWFRTFMTHIHFLCSARWFGIIQLKQSVFDWWITIGFQVLSAVPSKIPEMAKQSWRRSSFSRRTHNSNTDYTKQLAIQDDVWILMITLLCYAVSWLSQPRRCRFWWKLALLINQRWICTKSIHDTSRFVALICGFSLTIQDLVHHGKRAGFHSKMLASYFKEYPMQFSTNNHVTRHDSPMCHMNIYEFLPQALFVNWIIGSDLVASRATFWKC